MGSRGKAPALLPNVLLEPLGLLAGSEARAAVAAGVARRLGCGGAFTVARLVGSGVLVPVGDLPVDWLPAAERLAVCRGWAGLALPAVMGILNVTPDSFSDGGDRFSASAAIEAGFSMVAAGAALLDVGGESTRPGAAAVSVQQEQDRILPVVAALAAGGAVVSVDTRNAATMAAALVAGARIVNDVSGLTHDAASAGVVAGLGAPVVLMHMRGTPDTMGRHAVYDDLAVEVVAELTQRVEAAVAAGISRACIAVDPGVGFAKVDAQNQELLGRLPLLLNLGCPLVVGVSRKSFIGAITQLKIAKTRGPGSLSAALFALSRGASVLRVHDVAETVQAVRVWQALCED